MEKEVRESLKGLHDFSPRDMRKRLEKDGIVTGGFIPTTNRPRPVYGPRVPVDNTVYGPGYFL